MVLGYLFLCECCFIMQIKQTDIVVVGAGIVGLAIAWMCLRKGWKVTLLERNHKANGASVRNFGMVWPVGQQGGKLFNRALRSRELWIEASAEAGFWINRNGSLHLAYNEAEWQVLNEFYDFNRHHGYSCQLLSPGQVRQLTPYVKLSGLKGGLHSLTECVVYAREAIRVIPEWLRFKYGLEVYFGTPVLQVSGNEVFTPATKWKAQKVFVCSGVDFDTLYPDLFRSQPITRCKLQMMRGISRSSAPVGPSLCAGLTLRHYASFANCPSVEKVSAYYDELNPFFREYGIHVLVSQNQYGEFILGDSHQYGLHHDPFNDEVINRHILNYLNTFFEAPELQVVERWNGYYAKMENGATEIILQPEPHVNIINGLGGAGMTLSFGLAEEVVNQFF